MLCLLYCNVMYCIVLYCIALNLSCVMQCLNFLFIFSEASAHLQCSVVMFKLKDTVTE